MADIDAAFKTGYVAGLGFEAYEQATDKPYRDVHTPWTNYVPTWIPHLQTAPLALAWRRGWDLGRAVGRGELTAEELNRRLHD